MPHTARPTGCLVRNSANTCWCVRIGDTFHPLSANLQDTVTFHDEGSVVRAVLAGNEVLAYFRLDAMSKGDLTPSVTQRVTTRSNLTEAQARTHPVKSEEP